MDNTAFDASRLRSERAHARGWRAARFDINHGSGLTAQYGKDMMRENSGKPEVRDFWKGYTDAMVREGRR